MDLKLRGKRAPVNRHRWLRESWRVAAWQHGSGLSMGSRNPYPKPENPKLLVLEKVFFEVWTVITAHEPHRDFTQDHQRKVKLSWMLMALAATA